MSIVSLEIQGFRGFSRKQSLRFAQPNYELGSGLTIMVGPNNGGKSTVVESLYALSHDRIEFTQGERNKSASSRISISAKTADGKEYSLQTSEIGGSLAVTVPSPYQVYVLPSRRFFSPYFNVASSQKYQSRKEFLFRHTMPRTRSDSLSDFAPLRLSQALRNKDSFNAVLAKITETAPDWSIELSDEGNHFLTIANGEQEHNSDGLGQGFVSLLFIVDALYDSIPGDLIVIDEPEQSLHPAYQRKVSRLLAGYARDRQILYATHSPYFVDFQHIIKGAEVVRIHKEGDCCLIDQLCHNSANALKGLLKNSGNPHILGLNAREAFFQEEGVIVFEGQEDVVYYTKILDQLAEEGELDVEDTAKLKDRFFGWGAGGAGNIDKIVAVLRDLGFKRVAAILDSNERGRISNLQEKYPGYFFDSIAAIDVRTKEDLKTTCVKGLLDANYLIRPEFKAHTVALFAKACRYIQSH